MVDPNPRLRTFPRTLQLVHRLEFGGAELLAERFAHAFGGPDRVVLGCLDSEGPLSKRLRADGFKVVSFARKPGPLDYGCFRRIRRLVADEGIELIHAHQATPFFYSLLARGLFASRPRILFTEHGRFFPDRRNWKRSCLQPFLLGNDDRIAAVGESVRLAVAANEGIPWSRIEVIVNGIDVTSRTDTGDVRSAVRSEFGISPDAFVVAMAARLDPIKNHGLVLSALQKVTAEHSNVKLLIIGDGPERAPLVDQLDSLQLRPFVVLTGSRTDVRRLFASADVAVLTSVSEGIPLSLIEAMAEGLPVVATSVGGVPEVVEHGVTGILVPSGDDKSLADALSSLIADPALRRRMGEAGLARARRLFDEKRMFAEYAELISVDLS